jgi:hypothetical protein
MTGLLDTIASLIVHGVVFLLGLAGVDYATSEKGHVLGEAGNPAQKVEAIAKPVEALRIEGAQSGRSVLVLPADQKAGGFEWPRFVMRHDTQNAPSSSGPNTVPRFTGKIQ